MSINLWVRSTVGVAVAAVVTIVAIGVGSSSFASGAKSPREIAPPVLVGDGMAVFKCFIHSDGAETASLAWLPPNSWNRLADESGAPTRAAGVQRDPTALKVEVIDDSIPGLAKGSTVLIHRVSEQPWFVPEQGGEFPGITPTIGLKGIGWGY
ncbi:MAG TPA: hypothetical protein PKC43_02350 [Phycisphaerales bacterium]|nr:hypothetical protein [Phycisphaerales bacterium]HMP36266.1 hypothetical protein [Phycisphaerales bacterium]